MVVSTVETAVEVECYSLIVRTVLECAALKLSPTGQQGICFEDAAAEAVCYRVLRNEMEITVVSSVRSAHHPPFYRPETPPEVAGEMTGVNASF